MNLKALAATFVSLNVLVKAAPRYGRQTAGVITSCTKPGTMALTFDDGPYIYSEEIVKTLNDHGAKGTFFYNGNNYGCIYDEDNVQRVLNVMASGHQIASHTWSHPHLPTLSADKIKVEMTTVHEALTKITGAVPAFMRPPYGEYNDNVVSIAQGLGETVVTWDFDSGDSVGADVSKQQNSYANLLSKKPGTIISLEHEPLQTTAEQVLPSIIGNFQAAGYQLVTVAECLGAQPYQSVGSPAARDDSWTCGSQA